ncbi:MAG: S41 family peptidase [bacterium]|nr:S41 family peptidase [bacterium]
MEYNDNRENEQRNKKQKNKFWKGFVAGMALTAFAALCLVGVSSGIMMFAGNIANNSSASANQEEAEKQLNINRISQKSQYIQRIIEKYFYFDEDFDKVEQSIYSGLIAGLEDPYAAYYDEETLKKVLETTEGVYCGIGAVVSQNLETGVVTILRVYKGTPAEEAGLMAGDILYKVADMEVSGEDLDILVNQYVRGEEGTSVTIEVYRPSIEDYITVDVTRRRVETPTVEHEMLEDHVGYVLVTSFENITDKQFREAIEDLKSQGMERLVLDLRSNPGGTLDAAIGMMSYMLPDGLLFYDENKNGEGTKFVSENGKVWKISYTSANPESSKQEFMEDGGELDMPTVILVNENSASAAEAFTSAMRDFDRAKVVGTTTFGKGIVQTMIPLGDGSAVKMTTSQYFTKSGYSIHKQGLIPDVEVELDEEIVKKGVYTKEEDNQLQTAIETVKTIKE